MVAPAPVKVNERLFEEFALLHVVENYDSPALQGCPAVAGL